MSRIVQPFNLIFGMRSASRFGLSCRSGQTGPPTQGSSRLSMPKITINGKICEFEKGQMILQAALANGVEIPHYCYHEGLSIVASCRICLGEVSAPNPKTGQLETIPRLLPTCQTPCGEGQVVTTVSPKAVANQKAVMEYLLINHPLDCPVCDQAGECLLQDYSYEYGRSESRFQEDKYKKPKKDIGPTVWLYSDRCIMCSRCVRFTREVTGTGELCVSGRGATEQVDVFPGMPLDNELAGNVVDICPVGALLDKDFLFEQRVWLLKEAASIDGLTAGGDNIWIHHNEGRIWRVKPRKNLDVNKWWISDEIRYGWKFVHSPHRLASPVRNQYSERVCVPFSAAYEEVRENVLSIAGKPGAKLAVLVSPMLTCEEAWTIGKFAIDAMGGDNSRVVLGVGPVPVKGIDKTYPPGAKSEAKNAYTMRAEKAPNARGVKRALAGLTSGRVPLDSDAFNTAIAKDAAVEGVIVTGNYPSEWVIDDFTKALTKKWVLLIDTLPNKLTAKADVVLPGATWAEKSGTFENAGNRLQVFEQAISEIEGCKSEGQIFADLRAVLQSGGMRAADVTGSRFDAAAVRAQMADAGLREFVDQVHVPAGGATSESDMAVFEL